MRSRSGSEASVLSIHFVCAGVSGVRGSNGAARVDGAGSGTGAGRGGIDATVALAGCCSGAGLRAHDTETSVALARAVASVDRTKSVC